MPWFIEYSEEEFSIGRRANPECEQPWHKRRERMNMFDRIVLTLVPETLLKCQKLPLFTSQNEVGLSSLKLLCRKAEFYTLEWLLDLKDFFFPSPAAFPGLVLYKCKYEYI